MSRLFAAVMLTLAMTLSPAPAGAEMIDFTGMGHRSVVGISLTGGISASVYAGEMNWLWVGTPPDGFSQAFFTYCVDLQNYAVDPQTVTVRSTNEMSSVSGLAPDGGAKAAWLFDTYAANIRASGTNAQGAALQVAIWEALYDASSNLTGDNFRVSATESILTQAGMYLDALYSAPGGYQTSAATWLDTNHGQDQITARVSEPPTLLLFGFALVMFAGWLRRPV